MYRKTIISLIALFAGSGLIVAILYLYSADARSLKNGFLRLYPAHVFGRITQRTLPNRTSYIIGVETGKIFIGNYKDVQTVLETDTGLSFLHSIRLTFPITDPFLVSQSRVMVDSGNFYAIQQLKSVIFRIKQSNISAVEILMDSPNISSSASVPLSASTFILRTYYDPLKQNILTKRTQGSPFFHYRTNILEKQVDGIFCTDGNLLVNTDSKQIIYVYTYRNQFICLDSNLNILYRARTIDTNTVAKIKVTEIKSQNQTVLSSPPFTVNRLGCVSGDQLFVNSALPANNEAVSDFKRYAVIDVYNSKNGDYEFSFYVAKDHKKPISSMALYKNEFIMIQGATLFIYTLNNSFIH